MMQSHLAGGTDVHSWALADGFHAAENFDRVCGVGAIAIGYGCGLRFIVESCFRIDLFGCHSDWGRTTAQPTKTVGRSVALRMPFLMPLNFPQITEFPIT